MATTKQQSTPTEQQRMFDYEYAPGWTPNEGDVVEGKIVTIDTGANRYGAYPIVTIQQADGSKVAVHAFHSTLRSALARIRPVVGDTLGVKYLGMKPSSTNPTQTYAHYRVMGNQAGGYDWSREPDAAPGASDGDVPF